MDETSENEKLARMRSNYKNKQHVLVLASRGINSRYRHLMNDLINLLPHSKKDVKFDSKGTLYELNEVADMKNCNNIVFLECKRKRQDLFLWFAKTPNGPSIKFQATNVHTQDELKFSGNCLKGSRPLLFFDAGFDSQSHTRLIKEVFSQIFNTPHMHPKSKPFIDHMICFFLSEDGKIWFRNYQITEEYLKDRLSRNKEEQVLVEIGPRFVLSPIKILAGSFCGAPIYENTAYVPPSVMRTIEKNKKAKRYVERIISQQEQLQRHIENKIEPDQLDKVFDNEDNDEDSEDEKNDGEYIDSENMSGDDGASGDDNEDGGDEAD